MAQTRRHTHSTFKIQSTSPVTYSRAIAAPAHGGSHKSVNTQKRLEALCLVAHMEISNAQNGKWKEESGKRNAERVKWKVESEQEESGEWKVETGTWKLESGNHMKNPNEVMPNTGTNKS